MKNVKFSILLLPLAAAVVGLAVWGPEALAQYRDQGILDQVRIQEVYTTETEGYRYSLSGNEKLYILSKCLNSQTLPESEQSAMTRTDPANLNYEELTGSYAFVENRKDSSYLFNTPEDEADSEKKDSSFVFINIVSLNGCTVRLTTCPVKDCCHNDCH